MFLENYDEITDCIVLDTETVNDTVTLMPRVWEIGVVVIKNGEIVDQHAWMLSPDANFERLDLWYPKDHVNVSKIKSSPKFCDIYETELKKYLDPEHIVVGHNIDYDIRVTNTDLSRLGLPLIGSQKVDTIRLSRIVHPDWKRHNLDVVCKEYGLEIEKRHRALDDAYATALVFLKMRDILLERQKSNKNVRLGLF